MENEEIVDTLSEIRNLMERSSKVLSLSGTSSLLVGGCAMAGAFVASYFLYGSLEPLHWNYVYERSGSPSLESLAWLIGLAAVLIGISLSIVFAMSYYRAKRLHLLFRMDAVMRKMLFSFFLPLVAGGLLCLSQMYNGNYASVASNMLIFYGIALISISSFTYSSTKHLGMCEILVGLSDSFISGHSLFFWMVGFGILHILYGAWFLIFFEKDGLVRKFFIRIKKGRA